MTDIIADMLTRIRNANIMKYDTVEVLGSKMTLEIDPKSHPAWTGVYRLVDTGGQLSKFKNKFGAFGLKTSDSE